MGDGQLKGHEIAFHLNFGLKGRHVRRSSRRRKVKRPDEIRAKTSRRSKQTAPRGHAATLLKYLSSASSASWMVLPWGFKLWLEHPNCRSIEPRRRMIFLRKLLVPRPSECVAIGIRRIRATCFFLSKPKLLIARVILFTLPQQHHPLSRRGRGRSHSSLFSQPTPPLHHYD